ncbi:unnamed protein product [Mytilus edulis]|uniref:Uncharacterized protein n=1 Tax=Mytilus edulis TaxID=6550 RepID=A0A8S3RIL4_MYTED|nr:unnamed protein product [Mytilus edulis]
MKSIQNQNSEELQKASRESRELNKLSNNAKSYTQQYDFPTLIRSVKRFNPIEIYGEVFGDLENCSILDDVSLTQVNSYDINNADGISALTVKKDGTIWISHSAVTLNIIELTNDGKYIKTVPCNGKSYRMQTYECAFRISENINGHFCVSDEFGGKIVDYDEKGDHVWSYRECENPYGLVTSKLRNIVINDSNEFIYILNSDGEFLTKLNKKNMDRHDINQH